MASTSSSSPDSGVILDGEQQQTCLICQEACKKMHMGIEMCRACAVFYRRAKTKKRERRCRAGSNSCSTIRGSKFLCKSCRFVKINDILATCRNTKIKARCKSVSEEIGNLGYIGPILSRIHRSYNVLCRHRRRMEMEVLGHVDENAIPATFVASQKVGRILVDACPDFACSTFEEVHQLNSSDQAFIFRHFFEMFNLFDNFYRTLKYWKNGDKTCFGFTLYFDCDSDCHMLLELDSLEYVKDAMRISGQINRDMERLWRPGMQRLALNDVEFIACVGIILWDVSGDEVSEALVELAQSQKKKILHELHLYYKNQMGSVNYSSRIGEIFMMFSTVKECIPKIGEMFDVFKVLDVFDDDTYRQAKSQIY